ADALGGLFGGHGVFVHGEAEGLFVEGDLLEVGGGGRGGVEFFGDGGIGLGELGEQGGGDGRQVAAGQLQDLAGVAEGGAQDLGFVAEFFVVGVDLGDGDDAGVGGAGIVGGGVLGFIPVEDAADEGRDELHAGLGAGDGLGEGEEQG